MTTSTLTVSLRRPGQCHKRRSRSASPAAAPPHRASTSTRPSASARASPKALQQRVMIRLTQSRVCDYSFDQQIHTLQGAQRYTTVFSRRLISHVGCLWIG